MVFQSTCNAISKKTGLPCKQPVAQGAEYCRWHDPKIKSQESKSYKKGNTNALKHGAYSLRLLPEEELLYSQKLDAFTKTLGEVDEFDKQILHMLALIATKLDQAVIKGAEHTTYAGMVKQILDLMKELKATRASKDKDSSKPTKTFADLFSELKSHFEKVGQLTEKETNSLDNQVKKHCTRCLKEAWHVIKKQIVWECLNCGYLSWVEN